MKILLGVTGSVASKLTPKLVKNLLNAGHEVRVVATKASFYFWSENDFDEDMRQKVEIFRDEDEWVGDRYDSGIPVTHIELAKWADVYLIAPITANTLYKLAYGGADSLLTCVSRAWWNHEYDEAQKPLVIAPAMNTHMWFHPVTDEQVRRLQGWYGNNFVVVQPVSRKLACGDTGIGAMADIGDIVKAVNEFSAPEVTSGLV